MSDLTRFEVGGHTLIAEFLYDPGSHLWIDPRRADRWRLGLDPLGAETAGDIVAVSFEARGRSLERGDAFGSLEAAKFVGPLAAPVAGVLAGFNPEVLERPGLLNDDPHTHWLVELEPAPGAAATTELLRGREEIEIWFAAEIERVRREGLVAE